MYCSSCGNQIQNERNYCNRCGSRVSGGDPEIQKTIAANLSRNIGAIPCVGFIAFAAIVYVTIKLGVDPKTLIPIAFFYLASIVGITFLLVHKATELAGRPGGRKKDAAETNQPAYINPATTAQLEEAREPAVSITENTTRTLDEVLVKR